jgi:hypothetical protein
VGGGAWPILVGGVTRLVNFDNERDPSCLVGCIRLGGCTSPIWTVSMRLKEVSGKIRSVMPLDTLGGTRATMGGRTCYCNRNVG